MGSKYSQKSMMQSRRFVCLLTAVFMLLFLLFSTATPCFAGRDSHADQDITSLGIVTDMLVMRPVGLATTLGGIAFFAVTLPFTACKGEDEIRKVGNYLVVNPARYTFVRPVGDFSKPESFRGER